MNEYGIVIIGAGQLGSRHLQALAHVNKKLNIYVVDPSKKSLEIAKSRFEEVQKGEVNITYAESLLKDIPSIDVAIIATNADVRTKATVELLQNYEVRYLILEKLLTTSKKDLHALKEVIQSKGTQAWVNCGMRTIPAYADLVKKSKPEQIIFNVTGSNFGLITNAIHYLDYVSFLIGSNRFELNTSSLDRVVHQSKRMNFKECTGTLLATFDDKSIVTMTSYKNGAMPVVVSLTTHSERYIIKESDNAAYISTKDTNWKWQECPFNIPFQSEMTTKIVEKLLSKGLCDLTPFKHSFETHLQIMRPLSEFLHSLGESIPKESFPFT